MDRSRALTVPERIDCGCAPEPQAADWFRLGLGLVLSGQLMVLSLAMNLSEIDADSKERLTLAVLGLTALGVAVLGGELLTALREAWARRQASLESMFALAFIGGLSASLWGLLSGGPVFFEVVTVVLCVHAIGVRLKARVWASALDRVEAAALYPRLAHHLQGDALVDVEPEALRTDDVVVVFEGERVPAAGRVRSGSAWVESAAQDGDLMPHWVQESDDVRAGMRVTKGTLRVVVSQSGVSQAEVDRAALLRSFADISLHEGSAQVLARYFVPVVVTVAVLSGAWWGYTVDMQRGFTVASAVLLVACPCGFGIATPVAVWATAGQLGRVGVRVRRPAALETLAQISTVALDKTGTLTAIAPTVRWSQDSTPELKRWIGALEQWFDHPIARLLREDAGGGVEVRQPRTREDGGVEAEVLAGDRWRAVRLAPVGQGRDLEVQVDGISRALIGLEEVVLPGMEELLSGLRARQLTPLVLTGDHLGIALDIPAQVKLTAADKADAVVCHQADGKVLFVGDAPNDLPAMLAADVAVCLDSSPALVAELADVQLSELSHLPDLIDRSRQLRDRLRRLLVGSLIGNIIGISIAAVGLLHPVIAALIMTMTSLSVTLLAIPREEHP